MLFTRDDVERRILAGERLIVYRGKLLRVSDEWLDKHPGGSLALLHFIGRDATDEIEAFHGDDAIPLLNRFIIGTVELDEDGLWFPFLPPIMSGWVRRNGLWTNEAGVSSGSGPSEVLLVKAGKAATPVPILPAQTIQPKATSLSLRDQAQYSAAYRQLHLRIIQAGLYQTQYLKGYGPEILRYTLLGALSALAYHHNWFMLSAVFLGLMWHQVVFCAHDLGHQGVSHDWTVDRLLAIFIADFVCGLSIGWWVPNHNIHHLVTNHPSHDPDIGYVPFMAVSKAFFNNIWSTYHKRVMEFDALAKILVSIQHKLFYVVLAFGRFYMLFYSYASLIARLPEKKRMRGGRWAVLLEVVAIGLFWCWFGRILYGCGTWQKALMYLLVSHIVVTPLHVQARLAFLRTCDFWLLTPPQNVLSHFSMSTEDLGPVESFPHRQLRTTTDVICHPSLQFLHGGLHLQVTHHLFPRIPRHNLRSASMLVKRFTKEQGLRYAEFGFREGNRDVLGVLRGVANQVSLMTKVAESEARK